ncbi:MAG: RDD family protein [Roseovarius sp.]|nr:RDD family protein [Roseovarius sp.]
MMHDTWALPDPETQPEFYADVATKRFLAFIVDTAVIIVLCLLVLPFTAFTGLFFFPVLMAVIGFAYRVVTIARGSATWGMRLVAIEFRAADGRRFDLGLAFAHTLGLTISFALPLLQVASIVLMLTRPRGEGLSDLVLGTVAINRRAAM